MALELWMRAGQMSREVVMWRLIFHVRLQGRECLLMSKRLYLEGPRMVAAHYGVFVRFVNAIPYLVSAETF
jgi:hypothetical protein